MDNLEFLLRKVQNVMAVEDVQCKPHSPCGNLAQTSIAIVTSSFGGQVYPGA